MTLVWKALLFTGTAYLVPALMGWWLFASRVSTPIGSISKPSLKETLWLSGLLGLSGLEIYLGGLWDVSMHIELGIVPGGADFLWPPHIMIYGGFLITLVIALFAIGKLARAGHDAGVRDPRLWVRRNPFLGAAGIAALYSILSIPGDAIWHEIFGLDLTAWSPPHIILAVAASAVPIATAGLLLQARTGLKGPQWANMGAVLMLSVGVNLANVAGVIEWEYLNHINEAVRARPLWSYPVVSGGITFLVMMVAHYGIKARWSATAVALGVLSLRLISMATLKVIDDPVPVVPLVAVLGGILIDAIDWKQIENSLLRTLGMAAAFTAGYMAFAVPQLLGRGDLPPFGTQDIIMTAVGIIVVGMLVIPVSQAMGIRMGSGWNPKDGSAKQAL